MTDTTSESPARRPNVVCPQPPSQLPDIHVRMADDLVHLAGVGHVTLCGLDHEQPMYTGRRVTCERCKELTK